MTQERNDEPQPKISAAEYELWQLFIWQRCGLHFTGTRLDFLRRRLLERMRACRIWSYSDYYHYVAFNPAGQGEWNQLLGRLLNHETSFFRHPPSFEALTGYALPRLMQAKKKQGLNGLTIWSVGCSTGQEVYSLAIACLEMMAGLALSQAPTDVTWQFTITGSDLSPAVLDRARGGRYRSYEIHQLPAAYRRRYTTILENGWTGQSLYQITDQVRALAHFETLNLHDPASYRVPAQDIIFCQNVLIYFKSECRSEIVRHLARRLNPGGYLFLAPTELMGLKLPDIRPVRLKDVLIYQRTG